MLHGITFFIATVFIATALFAPALFAPALFAAVSGVGGIASSAAGIAQVFTLLFFDLGGRRVRFQTSQTGHPPTQSNLARTQVRCCPPSAHPHFH
jgi:hypothetical protein